MSDLKHLPKGSQLPENRMTKDQWKYYFECREKFDIEMSLDEISFWQDQMEQEFKHGNYEKAKAILKKIPYCPDFALGIKRTQGLGALITCNLSWAKSKYPDEF